MCLVTLGRARLPERVGRVSKQLELVFAGVDIVLGHPPTNRRITIVNAIERNLSAAPLAPSRTRKELTGLVPPRGPVRPVWQLRIGDYRVFVANGIERALPWDLGNTPSPISGC